jgi:dihydroneopterin aldolase
MMGQIRLNGMEFFAFHGCLHEEQVTGNNFLVDIAMDYDMEKASNSDDLPDALNYAEVYELVKKEMLIRSHLLEHLCSRILNRLFECFPQLNSAEVCVAKQNPPIGGKMENVSVSQKKSLSLQKI